jgi:hypothetical protein
LQSSAYAIAKSDQTGTFLSVADYFQRIHFALRFEFDIAAAKIHGERFMAQLRSDILPMVILACFAATAALAQGQTQPQPASKPAETSMPKMEDVSKWTQKQWNTAKAKWSEEKAKWSDCQTQVKAKNLSGRNSWQFLYDCMTK